MKEKRSLSLAAQRPVLRCKLVLVGDVQSGKTAMLQVLVKDSYPESYAPTVFENYTASLQLEDHRVELSLWDTSGSPYYDNVRPLCYSDSDAVLVCFDVSRPETLDSAVKKWKTEVRDYCPSSSVLLVGCKTDLRTDYSTLLELSSQHKAPVSQEQGALCAEQMGAEGYLECSAFTSEKSVHSAIRATCQTFVSRLGSRDREEPPRRFPMRILPLPGRSDLTPLPRTLPRDKAKTCCIM